tara:strand:- start:4481 stop:5071 length:591 start_codon:yes stop_codon:yes gene_type:complete
MKAKSICDLFGQELKGLKLINVEIFKDKRGLFYESWNQHEFDKILDFPVIFKQDNHSKSSKGVLRGLHYQLPPFEQGKLVRCTRGKIFDIAVDLRKDSPSFAKWAGVELSDENKKQFWIPAGFAHGFLSLSDNTEVQYKTTDFWDKESEYSLKFDDKDINIQWPIEKIFPEKIKLSSKDLNSFTLKELQDSNKIFI